MYFLPSITNHIFPEKYYSTILVGRVPGHDHLNVDINMTMLENSCDNILMRVGYHGYYFVTMVTTWLQSTISVSDGDPREDDVPSRHHSDALH